MTKKEPKNVDSGSEPTKDIPSQHLPSVGVVRVDPDVRGRVYEPPTLSNYMNFYKKQSQARRLAGRFQAKVASAALERHEPIPTSDSRRNKSDVGT